jgi:membrane-associated phospholipid phosphatase
MALRKYVFAAAVALSAANIAPAQSVGRMLADDFKNAGGDMIGVWLSPFRASGRDWLIAAGAGAAFGVSMLADQSVADWAADHDSSGFFKALKPVRRGGVAYTGKFIVPPVAALYVVGLAMKNQGMRDAVMGCAASWLSESAVRKGTYLVVARQRPDTSPNNPNKWDAPGDWENWQLHSFPAGHFANVMACASFWSNRFELGIAEPVIFAVAGGIGIGRILDRGHWTSDTVLGGILGYAIGREVARRSLARHDGKADHRRAQLDISPGPNGTNVGLRITY